MNILFKIFKILIYKESFLTNSIYGVCSYIEALSKTYSQNCLFISNSI